MFIFKTQVKTTLGFSQVILPVLTGAGAFIIGNEATRIRGAFKSSLTSILVDEPHLFSFK